MSVRSEACLGSLVLKTPFSGGGMWVVQWSVNSGLFLFQSFSFKREIKLDSLLLLQVLFNKCFLRNSCLIMLWLSGFNYVIVY